MICVCLLYYAYQGSHSEMPVRFFFTDITFGQNGTQASPEVAPILLQPEKSTFDGEGEVSPLKENPLSLSPNADRFQYSLIFFTSLAYMMYTISKENDWVTHRRTVLEAGLQDPNTTGGVGNFILYLVRLNKSKKNKSPQNGKKIFTKFTSIPFKMNFRDRISWSHWFMASLSSDLSFSLDNSWWVLYSLTLREFSWPYWSALVLYLLSVDSPSRLIPWARLPMPMRLQINQISLKFKLRIKNKLHLPLLLEPHPDPRNNFATLAPPVRCRKIFWWESCIQFRCPRWWLARLHCWSRDWNHTGYQDFWE